MYHNNKPCVPVSLYSSFLYNKGSSEKSVCYLTQNKYMTICPLFQLRNGPPPWV